MKRIALAALLVGSLACDAPASTSVAVSTRIVFAGNVAIPGNNFGPYVVRDEATGDEYMVTPAWVVKLSSKPRAALAERRKK